MNLNPIEEIIIQEFLERCQLILKHHLHIFARRWHGTFELLTGISGNWMHNNMNIFRI